MFPGKFGTFPQQKNTQFLVTTTPVHALVNCSPGWLNASTASSIITKSLEGDEQKRKEQIPSGKLTVAIEHGHRNSGFTHWKRWFSIVMLVYVSLPEGIRKIRIDIWIYVDMDMDHWYLIWIFSKKDTDWYGWIWGMRQPALDLGMFLGNSEFKQMALHQIWNN